MTARRGLALTVLLASTVAARTAAARGEQALSIELDWSSYAVPDPDMNDATIGNATGGGLGVIYEYTLSDELSLRGELRGNHYFGDDDGWLTLGTVGMVYRFDVLKYVPYGYLEAGGLVGVGSAALDGRAEATVTVGGGLDVLQSRTRSWGLYGALSSFAGEVSTFEVGVRLTTRWGFF